MFGLLRGNRTYIIAVATAVYAIAGVIIGQVELQHGIELVIAALGLGALRAGMK